MLAYCEECRLGNGESVCAKHVTRVIVNTEVFVSVVLLILRSLCSGEEDFGNDEASSLFAVIIYIARKIERGSGRGFGQSYRFFIGPYLGMNGLSIQPVGQRTFHADGVESFRHAHGDAYSRRRKNIGTSSGFHDGGLLSCIDVLQYQFLNADNRTLILQLGRRVELHGHIGHLYTVVIVIAASSER